MRNVPQVRYLAYSAMSVLFVTGSVILAYNLLGNSEETALASVKRCMSESESRNATTCARPHLQEMLASRPVKEVMRQLHEELGPAQCHVIGHVVGRLTYDTYRNTERAIADCDYSCDVACVHGVIGEAFLQELGIDGADFDVAHLKPEELRDLGAALCENISTCHGVGHALLQAYQDFDQSLAVCRDIAEGAERTFCYRGIFMEYADSVTWGGLRGTSLKQPDPLRPGAMCDQKQEEWRRACLRYFPRLAVRLLENKGAASSDARAQVSSACMTLDTEDRKKCIAGVGVMHVSYIFSDPERARHVCESFSSPQDEQACLLGMVSSATEYDRDGDVASFCSSLDDEVLRKKCGEYHVFTAQQLTKEIPADVFCKEVGVLCELPSSEIPDPWL